LYFKTIIPYLLISINKIKGVLLIGADKIVIPLNLQTSIICKRNIKSTPADVPFGMKSFVKLL
jgi:hypothetical protein